ncbi:patatin-like phospholipase family protein [Alteromonas mediterranea]|mgnify:FL=1|uniref:patatin-like phospholipase family protein n=1 Tax=Alteromonas mediterranea TaxID=314275 RepID=UPI0002988767|nr:patatin-like phospholipase family protein [Alteromonas mediterranea]AFV83901.1 patatin [Alteromonas mediterranea DE1]AGP95916.1 patatin [Alteromonas mediterranea UM7]AMJ81273.1 patatin [Alteromonas mediterranea]
MQYKIINRIQWKPKNHICIGHMVELTCIERQFSKLFLLAILFNLVSCAVPSRTITMQDLLDNAEAFSIEYKNDLDSIQRKRIRRFRTEYEIELSSGIQQSYDILVLSGGGELGAFGAGFLSGWGDVQDKEFSRPDFDSVSGVSTGALIAPFAFVGTGKAYETIVELYNNPVKDMIIAKTLFGFLAGNGAYYDAAKLHEQINQGISEQLVHEISQLSYSDKILLVGATNLDYGVMRVWDLSSIAASHPVEIARKKITNRLIASSAIPGAFPPIEINNNLYVDGGASMQVVGGIENRGKLYLNRDEDSLNYVKDENPIQIRIWIIINNKLVMEPDVTKLTWGSLAKKSLVSLMRGSTLQSIQDMETFSQMMNLRKEFDVKMRYVAIPQDYTIMDSDNMFDKEKMRALVELGRSMGANKESWKERAIRPGASFLDIKQ